MRRREFITLLGATAAWPRTVTAQSPSKVYRVGSLNTAAPVADNSPFGAAFIRGLAQHGYALDKNLTFERRGAEMQMDRLPRLVNELVTSKVDVIVAFGYPSALAAKQGTTLPVVSFTTGDPVGTGLVDSLARPGGNITGHLGRVGGNRPTAFRRGAEPKICASCSTSRLGFFLSNAKILNDPPLDFPALGESSLLGDRVWR